MTANGRSSMEPGYSTGALPNSQSMAEKQFGRTIYDKPTSAAGAKRMPIIRQAEHLDEYRTVAYKKGKQLGQGYYIVEISHNTTHFFIAAYDVESPESLLIELPSKRASDILAEFNGDYEGMASSLQVMNKRLVLLNPKFVQQRRLNTAPGGQRHPMQGNASDGMMQMQQ